MPRPGVTVHIEEDTARGGAVLDTGQAYMVGLSDRGPIGATKVLSLRNYQALFGSGPSVLRDSVMAFFTEAGQSSSALYVNRIAGPTAEAATATLGTDLTVDASSPGAWGNDLDVNVVAPPSGSPAGSQVLVVELAGEEVERSPAQATQADAAAWASRYSQYIRLTPTTATDPLPAPPATATLAGGVTDDTVDQASVGAALDAFGYQLGPGQALAPGLSTPAVHQALVAHAETHHRVALLDAPNTGSRTELEAAVEAIQPTKASRYAGLFAPWLSYPGSVAPATTIVPYSAVQAGLIARVDAAGNPAVSAAGDRSVHVGTLALLYEWSDADHEAMNGQGINLGKLVYGSIETYGYRTAAAGPETNWMFLGESRVVMAIAHEADVAAQPYVFEPIDGRGHLYSKLAKDLIAICQRYYDMDALYGATPQDAYRVMVAEANTVDDAAAGNVIAVIRLKTSKVAEWIDIPITKVPLERAV